MFLYHVLDIFFMVLHPAIMVFNLFGWIWRKTRLANLILLLLTGGSWLILGAFYGLGYCPFTQWHWEVLHHLGQYNLPDSYVTYLVWRMTRISLNERMVDTVTLLCFILALLLSLYTNIRSRRRKASQKQ